jgi:hypothetical protein
MQITLKTFLKSQREILKNLLEKYDYEFSQYDLRDVNELGLYGYDYLDYYWTEKKRWAFFIYADGTWPVLSWSTIILKTGKKPIIRFRNFFVPV